MLKYLKYCFPHPQIKFLSLWLFFCIFRRNLNKVLKTDGRPEITHTFDVWHYVKVIISNKFYERNLNFFPPLYILLELLCLKAHIL